MAFDIVQFRKDFPEFSQSNPQIYSDALINFWAGIGSLRLNSQRWGALIDHGLELFVAHHITISIMEQNSASHGKPVGQTTTIKSSKSVGDVSASIDVGAMIENDSGNYNLTFYGREFIRLARIVGIGGAQV